ncbi:hypothetical protein MMC30_002278 [Trapelia coarctata]|nr:hypothetical protein [Trapelia coarctata]
MENPEMLFPTVESVDEDYEPDNDPGDNLSRRNSLNSSLGTEAWLSLAPSTPPSPNATFPESVTRPLAYRESSLAPPSIVSDLYNVTPSSSPAPVSSTVRIPFDTSSENICAKLGDLRIESPVATEQRGDTYLECLSAQLADVHLESDGAVSHRPVPVREEQLPQAPFFDPNLQKAIKKAQGIMSNIAEQLGEVSLANAESGLHTLRMQALASRVFENDAVRTIGIVGESAAGKSSLINSLLDQREIARTDDNGSAVTAYVTEYRYKKTSHIAAFTIEAEFLTSDEIDLELKELLYDYRAAFRDGLTEETSLREYEEVIKRSDIALSTFRSIFSAHATVSEDFLRDTTPGAFEAILGHLQSLVSSLTWPEGVINGKWTAAANSPDEYREEIGRLSQEGLFPLIKIVRVYLNALVLKSGVTLADMPGLGDTNLARLQATKRYLDKCEQVFIVNRIGRAATSLSIQQAIKTQERKGLVGRKKIMTVVCTGSEDIDLDNAERRNLKAPKTKAINKGHIRDARAAIDRATESDSVKAMQQAQLRYTNLFVTARNNSIKEDVTRNYSSLANNHELRVFCVSNRYYEGTVFTSNDAKDIARSMSGIPELRLFCHTVVAEAQLQAAIYYLDVKCLGLLQQLELWTEATETEKTEPLVSPDCVGKLRDDLKEELDAFSTALNTLSDTHIIHRMRQDEAQAERHAQEESQTWNCYHWATYAAFCRNNGIYATKAQPFTNWNQNMLEVMNKTMTPQWTTFENTIGEKCTSLAADIKFPITRLAKRLKGIYFASQSQSQRPLAAKLINSDAKVSPVFLSTIMTQRSNILHRLQDEALTLHENISSTTQDALSGDVTSFIYTLMTPTYRACSALSGTGSTAVRRGTMQRHLAKRTLFRGIRQLVQRQLSEHFEVYIERVGEVVDEVCDAIDGSIRTVLVAEAGTERTSKEVLGLVRDLVVQGREDWVGVEEGSRRARREAGRGVMMGGGD